MCDMAIVAVKQMSIQIRKSYFTYYGIIDGGFQ
jgi:hypothetical protein